METITISKRHYNSLLKAAEKTPAAAFNFGKIDYDGRCYASKKEFQKRYGRLATEQIFQKIGIKHGKSWAFADVEKFVQLYRNPQYHENN